MVSGRAQGRTSGRARLTNASRLTPLSSRSSSQSCKPSYFYEALARTCRSCAEPRLTAAQGVGIALIVLALVGLGAFVADKSRVKRCIDLVDFGKLRVVLINAQILKSIPSSLNVVFPMPARALFAALDITALNPFTLIAGEVRRGGG